MSQDLEGEQDQHEHTRGHPGLKLTTRQVLDPAKKPSLESPLQWGKRSQQEVTCPCSPVPAESPLGLPGRKGELECHCSTRGSSRERPQGARSLTFKALLDKGSTDIFAEGALWAGDLGEKEVQGHLGWFVHVFTLSKIQSLSIPGIQSFYLRIATSSDPNSPAFALALPVLALLPIVTPRYLGLCPITPFQRYPL